MSSSASAFGKRQRAPSQVDVLIIGSGPAGATFARTIGDALPATRIMIIEAGPQLTARAGANVKNVVDLEERARAQLRSQGPTRFPYDPAAGRNPAVSPERLEALSRLARPGTFLINSEPERPVGFPAAGASSNVGGMGAHWTCACPRPEGSERIPFIPAEEMDRALARAEFLLHVRTDIFAPSVARHRIIRTLAQQFQSAYPARRSVGPMPLACMRLPTGELLWTGSDTILGYWVDRLARHESNFSLRTETLCRRLMVEGERVIGAVIEHLPTGSQQEIYAKFVVIAADSLRSPQLLWSSGIRPAALGHYLNEHPQILCAVECAPSIWEGQDCSGEFAPGGPGVLWVPFRDPDHPFHGQIMTLDLSPIPMKDGSSAATPLTLGMCWFCRKDIQFEDRIEFAESDLDFWGMPPMTIHYEYTDADQQTFQQAIREQSRAADCLGTFRENELPTLLPAGRSLHYQGTMRMGRQDDGTSVCDSFSRVWAFENLFLGGNGVIPTATACNPTLTTVALAARSAEHVVARLEQS